MLRKCMNCHRIFGLKLVEEKLIKTEDVDVVEILTEPNLKGEIMTKVERFVPGVQETHELTYQCRFCGEKHKKILCKSKKK